MTRIPAFAIILAAAAVLAACVVEGDGPDYYYGHPHYYYDHDRYWR
jgi:hypothetical protein